MAGRVRMMAVAPRCVVYNCSGTWPGPPYIAAARVLKGHGEAHLHTALAKAHTAGQSPIAFTEPWPEYSPLANAGVLTAPL